MWSALPAAAPVAATAAPAVRRTAEGGGGGGRAKKGTQTKSNRTASKEEVAELEEYDVNQIKKIVSVLMNLMMNVTMRTRQVEAITLITMTMAENTEPILQGRGR
eukprot:5124729-Pyramimonas_sp.AAC.1